MKIKLDDTNLSVSITQGSKIIDFWLGSWITALAVEKNEVKIEIKPDGVIELQEKNGKPNCMIYYVPLRGFVFTKANIPSGSNHPVSRTKKEMEMAFLYAEKREEHIKKALNSYESRYIYLFFIAMAFLILKFKL